MRLVATIRGAVQGVGFRPFVYRLAAGHGLTGWVLNSPRGVQLEVEGAAERLQAFLTDLAREAPPAARITGVDSSFLDPVGYRAFEIRASDLSGARVAPLLPDIGVCQDCLADIADPANRRYRYPFTNCTNCGPRFTIINALPYDRPSTTMASFRMCGRCQAEYDDPVDRRFHAQPIACPSCGPRLCLWDDQGRSLAECDEALTGAVGLLRAGKIVATKGIGGFQLLCVAGDELAVCTLRERKRREEKPFAVMVRDLGQAHAICELTEQERRVLTSPESPIVLAVRRPNPPGICDRVAPNCRELGVMLPYSPLHWLLMEGVDCPVVATSGNRADEPICTREDSVLSALGGIADAFLVHDRPIARQADDSIVRVIAGQETVLRRARGYAPYPVALPDPTPEVIVAYGTHLKNTTALAIGDQCYLGQHIGDLDTPPAIAANTASATDLARIYAVAPSVAASDAHPDYASTHAAVQSGLVHEPVQHHYAHALACMAENEIRCPFLAVVWDGTGLGPDGTAWGGEFLVVDGSGYRRVAHLRTFRLPGGDLAARQPRRSGLGALELAMDGNLGDRLPTLAAFTAAEVRIVRQAMQRALNSPLTSAAGRLFDAAASICGLRQHSKFEGQAAMELEYCAHQGDSATRPYPIQLLSSGDTLLVNWTPTVRALSEDTLAGVDIPCMARAFHLAMAQCISQVASAVGLSRVALSGGCFQNRLLVETVVDSLESANYHVYRHQRVPTNDGGVALGQVVGAIRQLKQGGN